MGVTSRPRTTRYRGAYPPPIRPGREDLVGNATTSCGFARSRNAESGWGRLCCQVSDKERKRTRLPPFQVEHVSRLPPPAGWRPAASRPTGRRYLTDSFTIRYLPSARLLPRPE